MTLAIAPKRETAIEAKNRETLQAYRDYKATGLHTTEEEVDIWLSTWGTDHEIPAPKCHR